MRDYIKDMQSLAKHIRSAPYVQGMITTGIALEIVNSEWRNFEYNVYANAFLIVNHELGSQTLDIIVDGLLFKCYKGK